MSRSLLTALLVLLPAAALAQADAGTTDAAAAVTTPAPATASSDPAAASAAPVAAPAPQPKKKSTGPAPTTQQAQEEAGDTSELAKDIGPLKSRIPPVTGHMFLMRHRFELTPMVGVSLRDAFFTKYMVGAELTYHLSEDFGIGARVVYAKPSISGAALICSGETGARSCRPPDESQVDGRAPGQIKLLGGVNVQWAPIYGKISLVSEAFLHFDLYAVGGVDLVQYAGPRPPTDPAYTKMTPGGHLGLGMRFFLNRWMTVRTELGDVIYNEDVYQEGNKLRNQLMFNLGVSFFFPMSFHEG